MGGAPPDTDSRAVLDDSDTIGGSSCVCEYLVVLLLDEDVEGSECDIGVSKLVGPLCFDDARGLMTLCSPLATRRFVLLS